MNEFFCKYVGECCERRLIVATNTDTAKARRDHVLLDLESGVDRAVLTPEQAKAIGRALIKAAKWAEAHAKT